MTNTRDAGAPQSAGAKFAVGNAQSAVLELSGLEALKITPDFGFAVIGERTNITGSPKFSKLISLAISKAHWLSRSTGARRRKHARREHGRGHRFGSGDGPFPEFDWELNRRSLEFPS
jgi:hypothetical protein